MKEENIKVLLAEDDANLGSILKSYLQAKGYDTDLFEDGDQAYEAFKKKSYDFCILDIMMPLKDGFTLAKEIRKDDKDIPILFLTAKSLQEDIIEGFKIGADDYLTKPFSMEELLMRMEAVLRRSKQGRKKKDGDEIYKIGIFTFNYKRQELSYNEKKQKLTSKEADLLKLLCDHMNNILERPEALKKIWKDDSYFNARSMDVYVAKIRKYLKADPNVELLNIHGRGFKLVVN
jgi:DNA-binding response OmpR family regulator